MEPGGGHADRGDHALVVLVYGVVAEVPACFIGERQTAVLPYRIRSQLPLHLMPTLGLQQAHDEGSRSNHAPFTDLCGDQRIDTAAGSGLLELLVDSQRPALEVHTIPCQD